MRRLFSCLSAAFLAAGSFGLSGVAAAENAPAERIVAPEAARVLEAAYKDFEAADFPAAKAKLDGLLEKNLSGADRAAALELRANARLKLGDRAGALADLEAAIATGALSAERVAFLQEFAETVRGQSDALGRCGRSAESCLNEI
jgi:tetratricopeptide (TPR) repeat protein